MPIMPASVNSSAYSDHSVAAVTPSEIRVSMVAAPCRRLITAARWNGHAAHVTTGSARASEAHCHPGNCHAGTIDSAMTGTARVIATRSRVRSARASASSEDRSGAGTDAS